MFKHTHKSCLYSLSSYDEQMLWEDFCPLQTGLWLNLELIQTGVYGSLLGTFTQ